MYYFHTCGNCYGRKFVLQNAPFLSQPNKPKSWQWLSQGYYFWTNEDHFAHIWGRDSYHNEYAIIRCEINIADSLILNLVSDIKQSLYFIDLINMYQQKLKASNPGEKATVTTVIEHFRQEAKKNKALFPFEAIKATDSSYSAPKINFTPNTTNFLITIPRIQLCLFSSSLSAIINKELYFIS